MGDQNKNVPRLRFPGYTDAWVKCKLGDVGKTFTGLSGKTKEDFGHGEGKFVTYINVFKNPISDLNELENVEIDDNQAQVNYGDVLFTTSSETPDEVGMSSVWLGKQDNIYLNSFCFGYRPQLVFDYIYLAFMLRSPSIRNHFMLLAQGISRYNISKNKAMEISVPIPELNEQTKIGEFFKHLDDLITVNERELNKLKDLKKSYLEKMFPKNGSDIPELRFPGYADAWVKCEFATFIERINISSDSDLITKVEFEDIKSGMGYLNKDISRKFDDRKGTLFQPKDILFGKLRPYLKNWLFPDFTGVALGDFWVFRALNSNPEFAYVLIQSPKSQAIANDTAGTKMPRSDWKIVSNSEFWMPSIKEQTKIGEFFKHLDNLITVNERELNKLKELKKSYLKDMFV